MLLKKDYSGMSAQQHMFKINLDKILWRANNSKIRFVPAAAVATHFEL